MGNFVHSGCCISRARFLQTIILLAFSKQIDPGAVLTMSLHQSDAQQCIHSGLLLMRCHPLLEQPSQRVSTMQQASYTGTFQIWVLLDQMVGLCTQEALSGFVRLFQWSAPVILTTSALAACRGDLPSVK